MKTDFIYNGFSVDVQPNGVYYCAIAVSKDGKLYGAFDRCEQKVIEKIMTKISQHISTIKNQTQ